jgi:hypothetical protein
VSAPEDAFDSTAGAQTGDIFVVDTLITDPPNGIDWLEGETFSAMIDGKLYEDVTTTGTPPYIALRS